jgi:succinyl-CoA synthetase alpha subunit
MRQWGTPLVAGVTPGRGGQAVETVPVFENVINAVAETRASHTLIVVPPRAVLDAVLEAADAGIGFAVVYTEGVPVHDAVRAIRYARGHGMVLCGPNSAGVVSAGRANLSDLNDEMLAPGRVGIVSKSGTLTYEVILSLREHGFGLSTVVCLGGDPIVGLDHSEVLEAFEHDIETDAVILVGEIGGVMESRASNVIRKMRKPVVSYIAGRSAPPEKRMGHAGAIVGRLEEGAESKSTLLAKAGARPATFVSEIGAILAGEFP